MANHAIASEGWRVPQDYGDAFTVLAERGVVTEDLAARRRPTALVRDPLVEAGATSRLFDRVLSEG